MRSDHHLFTMPEIRAKLVQIFGEPKTDEEHRRLHHEMRKCHSQMPVYTIDHKLHERIHRDEPAP